MVEIGTTHNVASSLRVWLVTLPDQHLTRPCLAECVLAIATGRWWSMKLTCQSMQNVLLLSRPILLSYCLLRPWFVCLSAIAYGDPSTMSQAEVPLEWNTCIFWEMGLFNRNHLSVTSAGVGAIHTENVLPRGHRLEGLK